MRGFLAIIFVLLLGIAGCSACNGSGSDSGVEALPNVKLGMAPRDVRERFQPGIEGNWQTALGTGDDTVLEWTLRSADAGVKPATTTTVMVEARFEFHLGMLVAIRARSNETTATEKIGLTPKTVTIRSPAREGGTMITVLARDCPTHKDEAEGFAAKAH